MSRDVVSAITSLPFIFFIECAFSARDRSILQGYNGVPAVYYRLMTFLTVQLKILSILQ
jgi:hypothetical protein